MHDLKEIALCAICDTVHLLDKINNYSSMSIYVYIAGKQLRSHKQTK